MDDVERAVGVGERPAVADPERQPGRAGHAGRGQRRRREDLGPAVEPDDVEGPPVPAGVGEERQRDVGAARPDVEDGQVAPVGREGR